ncbi:histidine phosphatase family protein [Aeromicrobium sp. UC242_57]|uniref:histidine phosphatase family protein n=1 Tax=Aeromicrobium sp. UC242_57 TaxID=3374624 RepID=UPI0037A10A27
MGSIHLIRHGQASWGAADYDQLSDLGVRQSSALGMSWEAFDWAPTEAWAGSLKRHAQTAIAAIDACGQGDGYDVDDGWNEYDIQTFANMQDQSVVSAGQKGVQQALNVALTDWMAGRGEHAESYRDFVARVLASFEVAAARATKGRNVAVFTSGGPIAQVVSHVLAGDDSLFQKLNDIVFNASVTTIIVGETGRRVLSFNEHTHLPKDMVTFR